MPEKTSEKKEPLIFDTSSPWAPLQGFLIIPFLAIILTFIGSIIMVTFQNPSELSGFDLFIYWTDAFYIPLLLIIFFTWYKRKKILPFLMMFYFIISAAWNFSFLINGFDLDVFNLAMSIIWFIYFIRSKRVKQTFVY